MRFRKLRHHQRLAIKVARTRTSVAFLMDMRLGKTLTSIRWARRSGILQPLVVCPKSVIHQWEEELEKESVPFCNLRERPPRPGHWNIINYDLLRSRTHFTDFPYDLVLLDESPVIRNPGTKIARILCNEFPHVKRRAILSGYPSPESLMDLFNQFHFLNGHFCNCTNYYQFRNRYFNLVGYDWYPRKGLRDTIREELDKYAIIQKRSDFNLEPGIDYVTRKVDMPASVAKEYIRAEKDYMYGERETKWKFVVDAWLARVAGGTHKDEAVKELFEGELQNEQAVIWFRYNEELKRVTKMLNKLGVPAEYIYGATEERQRKEIVNRFQQKKFQVLCMQIAVGLYGLNFSNSDVAIYYSCGYSADQRYQSMDRIIDTSKTRRLLVIDLVTRDTIDEDIRMALVDKKLSSGMVMRQSVSAMKARWHEKTQKRKASSHLTA